MSELSSEAAKKLSELGAAKGGIARASRMTPEERSEAARRAVEARWARQGKSPMPRATHDGILELGDRKIECAVLEDGTRVLSQRSFATAVGASKPSSMTRRGAGELPSFLNAANLKPFIDEELIAAAKPIEYIPTHGGRSAYGIKAEAVPKVCKVWLLARDADALRHAQKHLAAGADIIIRGLAEVGIIALVDEATGYQDDRDRRALAKILEAFVAKELRPWVHTFPVDYYKELYRLRGLTYPPKGNKMPRYFGVLTNDIVYARLAPGVLAELRRVTPRDEKGRLKSHLHRRLTDDVGHPKLLQHLGSVVTVMKFSPDNDYDGFKKLLDKHYPRQTPAPLFDKPEDEGGLAPG